MCICMYLGKLVKFLACFKARPWPPPSKPSHSIPASDLIKKELGARHIEIDVFTREILPNRCNT